MSPTIGSRPTPEDERILREAAHPVESTSDTLPRTPRLLDHERWLEQFHVDAARIAYADLNAEPEAW